MKNTTLRELEKRQQSFEQEVAHRLECLEHQRMCAMSPRENPFAPAARKLGRLVVKGALLFAATAGVSWTACSVVKIFRP